MAKSTVRQPSYSTSEAAKRRDTALAAALRMKPTDHGKGPERAAKKKKKLYGAAARVGDATG